MEINKTKIEVVVGKLSDFPADAYVLPYYPKHESPSAERLDVALGGALGVRDFIAMRLGQIRSGQEMRQGDCYITDARGGKSRLLANIICRTQDIEHMAGYFRRGLNSLLHRSAEYQLKVLAMVPLYTEKESYEQDFFKVLEEVLKSTTSEICVEKIIVVCRDKEQELKVLHILE